MSLQRLRRILQQPLSINVESTATIVAAVTSAAAARQHFNPKPASVYAPLSGTRPLVFRAIDLLRKIGELTTPKKINLARLSASWATRRYFWAVDDPGAAQDTPRSFRLSGDARAMERHQKTLLSDEFGMGFAGLIAEQMLETTDFVDVEFALSNPAQYFGAVPLNGRRPDFLMWRQTPLFVIECKGCQTTRNAVVKQLRRGLEQVPAVQLPNQPTVTLVIATYLGRTQTTVYVVDPPNDGKPPRKKLRRRKIDDTVERVGHRTFEVANLSAFREKLQAGADVMRLRWIGQHQAAARLERQIGGVETYEVPPNAQLERLETGAGEFLGIETALTPELGPNGPRLFRGVAVQTLQRLDVQASSERIRFRFRGQSDSDLSVGPLGTCVAILDLPE